MDASPAPAGAVAARRLTEQLRAAMTGAHRALAQLAERTRAVYENRVWAALGYSGWGAYAEGELGISRAQAYRLLNIADTLHALSRAVAPRRAGTPTVCAYGPDGCSRSPISGHCASPSCASRFVAGLLKTAGPTLPPATPGRARAAPRPCGAAMSGPLSSRLLTTGHPAAASLVHVSGPRPPWNSSWRCTIKRKRLAALAAAPVALLVGSAVSSASTAGASPVKVQAQAKAPAVAPAAAGAAAKSACNAPSS
ncbi:hypothetical protein [Actinacidiphila acididurans]|uniref:Uncharacterized protein n=1 Tax=Actinacidiphila acididurans TaxID=2784346 RepID=A0ABS2TTI6_9ACTN|nr:hypothetical protein [Actinacidiphila acididurans]MBM9506650.1 hypothetical protein [Actinacidiphila acididurans]